MNIKIITKVIAAQISIGLLSIVPTICQAAAIYNDHYLGVSFGSTNTTSQVSSISDAIDYKHTDTAAAVQYRKMISNELALELSYMDFGEVSLQGPEGQQFFYKDTTRIDFGPDAKLSMATHSIGLNALFRAWLTNSFAAGVRIGYHVWTSTLVQHGLLDTSTGNAPTWSETDSGGDLYWSLGFQYALGSLELGLRAETVNFNGQLLEQSKRVLVSVDYGFRL